MVSAQVEARHRPLEEALEKAPTVDAALAAHDAFLDAVLKECLLANHTLLHLLADLAAARSSGFSEEGAVAVAPPGPEVLVLADDHARRRRVLERPVRRPLTRARFTSMAWRPSRTEGAIISTPRC